MQSVLNFLSKSGGNLQNNGLTLVAAEIKSPWLFGNHRSFQIKIKFICNKYKNRPCNSISTILPVMMRIDVITTKQR